MTTYLCPLFRRHLQTHPTQANQYVQKAQQAVDDYCQTNEYHQAFAWSGHALEASQIVLDVEAGWSIHTIMQFSAATITFCKLAKLVEHDCALQLQASIDKLQLLNKAHQLDKVSWVQECLHALRLLQEQLGEPTYSQFTTLEQRYDPNYLSLH
jgi:hypothetical protein